MRREIFSLAGAVGRRLCRRLPRARCAGIFGGVWNVRFADGNEGLSRCWGCRGWSLFVGKWVRLWSVCPGAVRLEGI